MPTDSGTIFVLTRADVIECARELGIPEESITDDVLARVKKGVEWGLECWSDVVKTAIREAIDIERGNNGSRSDGLV